MTQDVLGVAMVGAGFMGAAHSQAWRVAPAFFELPLAPVRRVVFGRRADATEQAARRWGCERLRWRTSESWFSYRCS